MRNANMPGPGRLGLRFLGVDLAASTAAIDVPMCTNACPCLPCRISRGEVVVKSRSCGKTSEIGYFARS